MIDKFVGKTTKQLVANFVKNLANAKVLVAMIMDKEDSEEYKELLPVKFDGLERIVLEYPGPDMREEKVWKADLKDARV